MKKQKKKQTLTEEVEEIFKDAQHKTGLTHFHDSIEHDEDAYRLSDQNG